MRTAAVLPVKRFGLAKRRMDPALSPPLRAELAAAMVEDVLEALAGCAEIDRTIVITAEARAQVAAEAVAAEVLPDADERGQSAAAGAGVRHVLAAGFDRALCVPGDCPALDPDELRRLLAPGGAPAEAAKGRASGAARATASVTIVPDRHGSGTNALLLAPPAIIAPAFGPGSFARHRELAVRAGAEVRVERPPSLLLDIDTGADLAALRATVAPDGGRAARTLRLLRELEAAGAAERWAS